jgi:hypothetical protein
MSVSFDEARRFAAEVMAPAHFFVAPDLELEWSDCPREETVWEIFRGRLLDPAHTRQRTVFETWNVWERAPEGRSGEPVLSLKLDVASGVTHVVRGLECYVWEGYDSGGGVILSRERRKWVRELVASLRLADFADVAEFRDELAHGLYSAVVGSSRLPLTSVEAPLPSFSFGRLFYCYRGQVHKPVEPLRTWRELLRDMLPLAREQQAHLLETFLHVVRAEEMAAAAAQFTAAWRSLPEVRGLHYLWRDLFNGVSLSPWTDLTDKLLAYLRVVSSRRTGRDVDVIDFLSHVLRQIGRHLTAYDLIMFHHRGANYPDALLLDGALKDYLRWIERFPDRFVDQADDDADASKRKRLRRRALRAAWLIRRRYEGHPVPDAPTSPGENNRVLPPSHPRVPIEQILQTTQRRRKLYDGDPLTNHLGPGATRVLQQAVLDLRRPAELRELGAALFLDRPLSHGKAPGEPDATPLFASVAFSRSIAVQRVHALAKESSLAELRPLLEECLQVLMTAPPRGLPVDQIGGAARPGVVSLTDARLASPDFEFLHTTSGALGQLNQLSDFQPLQARFGFRLEDIPDCLLVRAPDGPALHFYDVEQRLRLVMEPNLERGFIRRRGVECPASGLLVRRLWVRDTDGCLCEVRLDAPIVLPRRET